MSPHAPILSPSTQRAYASDWRNFSTWCADNELQALPAEPATIVAYLDHCAERLRPATIQRRVAAISTHHKAEDLETPTTHSSVASALHRIRRALGAAQAQKEPVLLADVRRMVATLGSSAADVRDRAVLLLGFACASRRSELVALDIEDLEEREEGMLIHVRRSKTDQEGRGITKPVFLGGSPDTCPVTAVRRWLQVLRQAELLEPTGPLFRTVSVHGTIGGRLSDAAVARIVKRLVERIGLDPAEYAGHSLRAGAITELFEAGESELHIMELSGHKSVDVLKRYVRRKDPFRGSAGRRLGL